MFRPKRQFIMAAIVLVVAVAPGARAQTGDVIRVPTQSSTSAELFRFGLNTWDRTVLGARARGMGGASLAMPGDASNVGTNPAAISWMPRPELASETRYRVGSATGTDAPPFLQSPIGDLPLTDYRPGLATGYTYNDLSFAMPLSILDRSAGFGLSYRRLIDFKSGEETRFHVDSPQGEADFGQGTDYSGGVDAITPSFAWNLNRRVSFGAALNFMSGTITGNGNQGVTSFGFVVARGGLFFEQKVHGTSLDLGTRLQVMDNLSLGGVVQTGHKLKFTEGEDAIQALPDPSQQNANTFIFERDFMDHELSVPTMYGVGMSYSLLGDRLTLAADYWNRGWSRSEITRNTFDISVLYPDSTNLAVNHIINVIPGTEQETKNAGLKDTHHFRIGAEWMLKKSDDGGMEIPIRVGFRNEPFTFSNADTNQYNDLYQLLLDAAGGSGTLAERKEAVTDVLKQIYSEGSTLLTGSEVSATTLTAGAGVRVGAFAADISIARTSFTVDRFFLGAFSDYTRSHQVFLAGEDQSTTEFTFTTSLRF